MALEFIAEDGSQRQHRQWLRKLLNTTRGPVRVASAYVTDDDLLFGIKNRNVQLLTSLVRMDIVSGATSLRCLRSLIKSGVQCCCLSRGPRFHAKVYVCGDQSAVVTSANLTTNALNSNIEVGVHVTGTCVQELITWFDVFWKKANPLDLPKVSKWEKETEALRRAYAALRRKASAKPALPNEAMPSVRSPSELRDLAGNARGFFVCNTNRRHSPDGTDEALMRRSRYAAVWTEFNHRKHMERVGPGAAILMFAKGVGIIGVGRATGRHEVLPPGHPARITTGYRHEEEWRVPVDDWLAWAENEEDAYRWTMPNARFLDISGDKYRELCEAVFEHFLRDS
jgi:hypothetical protein